MIEQKIDELIEALNNCTAAMNQAASPADTTNSGGGNTGAGKPSAGNKDLKTLKKEAIALGIPRDDVINLRKAENVQAMIDEFKAKNQQGAGDDDLDLDLDGGAGEDEDGLGLDLDEEEPQQSLTLKDVKAKLGEVAQTKSRETVLKIFKKFGIANANDLPEDKYRGVYDLAVNVLTAK